jgi:hypothetical protein
MRFYAQATHLTGGRPLIKGMARGGLPVQHVAALGQSTPAPAPDSIFQNPGTAAFQLMLLSSRGLSEAQLKYPKCIGILLHLDAL